MNRCVSPLPLIPSRPRLPRSEPKPAEWDRCFPHTYPLTLMQVTGGKEISHESFIVDLLSFPLLSCALLIGNNNNRNLAQGASVIVITAYK